VGRHQRDPMVGSHGAPTVAGWMAWEMWCCGGSGARFGVWERARHRRRFDDVGDEVMHVDLGELDRTGQVEGALGSGAVTEPALVRVTARGPCAHA
jgi:hypothetical protein